MLEKREIILKLQSVLSNKRYLHTLGMADEAVKLAERHGANVRAAETAGLLHDCAKCIPDSLKLSLCREYHIPLNNAMLAQPDLTHSFLGAEIARREYGCADEEILAAIRYHTTGRPNMSVLEKIIYLADFFEPGRKPFNSMDKIKEFAYMDLNEAMLFSLEQSVEYIGKKGSTLHSLTTDALDYYKNAKEEYFGN